MGRRERRLLFARYILCLSVAGIFANQAAHPAATAQASTTSSSIITTQMSAIVPAATFHVGGDPDWMAIAQHAVWVTSSSLNRVTQLNAADNSVGATLAVDNPCSGLIAAFGSLWSPSCGAHSLIRADVKTGSIQATIAVSPADSEGCIAAGDNSVWLATSAAGILSRISQKTNSVIASITVPSGSFCPVHAGGFVWITSTEHSLLAKIDPSTNKVVAEIPVGKNPRFATSGAGSVWTLNQGDGTISRVDIKSGKLLANIPAGLVGHGGEITFGFGSVWATLAKTPITRIDARTNAVIRQWTGDGGDSIRAGLNSIWLTNLKAGVVWRISPEKL